VNARQKENDESAAASRQYHDEDIDSEQTQDAEEYLPLTEQTAKMSTADQLASDKIDVGPMDIDGDGDGNDLTRASAVLGTRRRRSRFRFSFSNQNPNEDEHESTRKSRLARTLSASILHQDHERERAHEPQHPLTSSRRRKSYSSTGLVHDLQVFAQTEPTALLEQVRTCVSLRTGSTSSRSSFIVVEVRQDEIVVGHARQTRLFPSASCGHLVIEPGELTRRHGHSIVYIDL
jgi:hypothetical protein